MILGIPSVYFWLIALVVLIVIEMFTLDLTAIWFGAGSVCAIIAGAIGFSIPTQCFVFIVASALLLIFTRPLVKKFVKPRSERTNFDRIVGQQALVTETVNDIEQTGQIKIMGQVWTARTKNNTIISVGQTVKIVEISGVKVIVEPIETI